MLSKEEKREAVRKFREQKVLLGIYAVRCTSTNQVWVGSSRNLGASRNGTWFSLRLGSHRDLPLQEAWNQHGEPAFTFEELETLEDDVAALLVSDLLKARKQHWMGELGARGLL